MRPTVNLQAVTDRVFGLAPVRGRAGARRSPRGDMAFALALLLISAAGSAGALGLWAAGHGVAGLRLFCGSALLLLVLLRLR
jgi:hypothetical protein